MKYKDADIVAEQQWFAIRSSHKYECEICVSILRILAIVACYAIYLFVVFSFVAFFVTCIYVLAGV